MIERFSARTVFLCGLAVASLLGAPRVSLAQPASGSVLSATTLLPAAGLAADVRLLREAYGALHPGLYRYNSTAQIDEAFAALEAEFARDRTLADAYLAFARFAGKIRCGHTYANFYNQTEAVRRALFEAPRLPFHFRWLGERMIVERSFVAGDRLVAGSEILAIDGVPVAEILRQLLPLARADGGNDAKRVSSLEVRGLDRFEAFDIYYPLLFPPARASFELTSKRSEGAPPEVVRVPAHSFAERLAATLHAADLSPEEPVFSLTFVRPQVAMLSMPNWALYDSKWDWQGFLDEAFGRLVQARATDLIFDLRGNEGGMSIGDSLLAHLVTAPLPEAAKTRQVRYRKIPSHLRPYLDTWDRSFDDWGEEALPLSDGFYRLTRYDDAPSGAVVKPRAPRFDGRVWVLVGAANSSATFEFAEEVQRHQLGFLVGQPTGGNQRGINGGAFYFLRLPNSGLELDLPLIATFPAEPRPDAGLLPDIPVTPTVADIAAGADAELRATLAAIDARR